MTDATKQQLIEKLEAATGPSRELDAEIAVASGQQVRKSGYSVQYHVDYIMGFGALPERVPPYTSSLDSTLTLFENEKLALSALWETLRRVSTKQALLNKLAIAALRSMDRDAAADAMIKQRSNTDGEG